MGYSLWYVKTDHSKNQDLSTSLESPYEELLNASFSLEIHHSELILWAVKERASKQQKKSLCSMGYSLWYVKTDHSKNQDLSTSLESPYEELLSASFSLEIHHSELILWAVKERASKQQKNPFVAWAIASGTSKLTTLRIKI